MARQNALPIVRIGPPLAMGLVDGPSAAETPHGAFRSATGFEFRRGFPYTEYGRSWWGTSIGEGSVDFLTRWFVGGNATYFAGCDGHIFAGTSSGVFNTTMPINVVEVRGTVASIADTTWSGTNTKWLTDLRVGDRIWLADDSLEDAVVVSEIVNNTTFIAASAYGGSAASGAYYAERPYKGNDVDVAVVEDRLWIADGTSDLYWYGPKEVGSATYVYRPAGVEKPNCDGVGVTLGSGGNLEAGVYEYWLAWKDYRGNVSQPCPLGRVTASAGQKCGFTNLPTPPLHVREVILYRSAVDSGGLGFRVPCDITVNGTVSGTTFTLSADQTPLVAYEHIGRFLEFEETGNAYRITNNTASVITLASAPTESGACVASIRGGFDAQNCTGIADYASEEHLVAEDLMPTYNDAPPAGLSRIVAIRGGAHLAAIDAANQRVYWSGRALDANKQGVMDGALKGAYEFDYWHEYACIGSSADKLVGIFELSGMVFVVKTSSVWLLDTESQNVAVWSAREVSNAVGAVAPHSIVVGDRVAWWLGVDGGELDVIRFDGAYGRGIMRERSGETNGLPRLRATLDAIVSPETASGAMFKGRYWLSYRSSATSTYNDATLRYDIKTRTVDKQPYGAERYGPADVIGGTPTLLGCAATGGRMYRMAAASGDLGEDMTRVLETPKIEIPLPDQAAFVHVWLDIEV